MAPSLFSEALPEHADVMLFKANDGRFVHWAAARTEEEVRQLLSEDGISPMLVERVDNPRGAEFVRNPSPVITWLRTVQGLNGPIPQILYSRKIGP